MTWTTIDPNGVTAAIGNTLIALAMIAMISALGLLYRLAQRRRVEGLRIPAEGLTEDQEEDGEP